MIKRPFISLTKPVLEYEKNFSSTVVDVPVPEKVTLLLDKNFEQNSESITIKEGDTFQTGQKFIPFKNSKRYLIASVTGVVSSVGNLIGNFGKKYTTISIKTRQTEEVNEEFSEKCEEPSLSHAANFLSYLPGNPPLNLFGGNNSRIKTIFVCGIDKDLLSFTNQYILKSEIDFVKKGIEILKKITGIEDIILVVPEHSEKITLESGAKVSTIESKYPAALPTMIAKKVLDIELPAGKSFEEIGISFINAEAVASIAKAYDKKNLPVTKLITFVKKDGTKVLTKARIGTSLKDLSYACDTAINDNDRVIIGGPMTGTSVYLEDFPISYDTDTVIVQGADSLSHVSDYPCINCGECIRACPAKVPVNMLVRFLEAGEYETAEDEYDLFSCIECGLCSFVCVSRIPVFQYIKLAKYELARIKAVEAVND